MLLLLSGISAEPVQGQHYLATHASRAPLLLWDQPNKGLSASLAHVDGAKDYQPGTMSLHLRTGVCLQDRAGARGLPHCGHCLYAHSHL